MRTAPEIVLTAGEGNALIRLSRSNTSSVRLARRARIGLLAWQGKDNTQIASELEIGAFRWGAGASAMPGMAWGQSNGTCRAVGVGPRWMRERLCA
jgi:hypothetical protein